MQHIGTKTLETERLLLRRFCRDDASAMYRNWASDPEVTRYLTWPTHTDEEVTSSILAEWLANYADERYYQWAIVPKGNGNAPIGSIAVVELDDQVKSAAIGYCIGRAWWNMGITSEALSSVITFLFEEVGINRVEAYHDPRNPHSGAVMRKCGMTYEGTFRQSARNNQGICDACWYAILKE